MALYANENGTLKEMSLLDSGSFKITGIDYFGALTVVTSNEFEVPLSKPLGSYKFIVVLPVRIANLNSQGSSSTNSGFATVISVSAVFDCAATSKIDNIRFASASASTGGFSSASIALFNIKELTEDTDTLKFVSADLKAWLVEFYGVF